MKKFILLAVLSLTLIGNLNSLPIEISKDTQTTSFSVADPGL
ncbi:hypothetical protein [Paenibacillus tyrfis]|nr:hypothetical protein [Paenibacillus tyrfis]